MKEYPMVFSAEMILALLARRKSVTRRIDKRWLKVKAGDLLWAQETFTLQCDTDGDHPPFEDGRPIKAWSDGDGFHWLQPHYRATDPTPELTCTTGKCDGSEPCCHWKPSIHMHRWASRITLEATEDARAERLQDITEDEARAEGIQAYDFPVPPNPPDQVQRMYGTCGYFPQTEVTAVKAFRRLWSTLHTKPDERFADNPEVVRLAFRKGES